MSFFWFGKKWPGYLTTALFVLFFSCRTSKPGGSKTPISNRNGKKAETVIQKAHSLLGTPYRYGGTDKKGLDCSGLTMICYREVGLELPRIAGDQASKGSPVSLSKAQPGDLVFFDFSKNKSKGIGHVGLISRISKDGEVFFIHASSSKGVIESSLNQKYYQEGFVKAVRPLQ